jgi:aryl-alcohol dehydrogenase-like predicted oxidoreductase
MGQINPPDSGFQLGNFKISKLSAGAVQFGMSYGIANKNGRPSYETARDILKTAAENGVNCVDTAAMYGDSEEVIGRALEELGIQDAMTVVSKIPGVLDSGVKDSAAAFEFMERSVTASLKRLRLKILPVCLFHREEDHVFLEGMERLKKKGLVAHGGISFVRHGLFAELMDNPLVEAAQVPFNILDRRCAQNRIFEGVLKHRKALFIRSVYLQGLLLMGDDEISGGLGAVTPALGKLRAIAAKAGVSMSELCVRHALATKGITSILTGVETVAQMAENAALARKGPLTDDIMREIEAAVPDFGLEILDPRNWKKRSS